MTDINEMITQTKVEIWALAEELEQHKDEIDQGKLMELVSNMDAFVKDMIKKYKIEL